MKLSLDLYRNSRAEFLKTAKEINKDWENRNLVKKEFFESFDHSKLQDYKEFVTLLEDLISVDFLFSSASARISFVYRSVKFLQDAYISNRTEYIDFIKSFNVEHHFDPKSLNQHGVDLYLLYNFLPSLYNFPELQNDAFHGDNHSLSLHSFKAAPKEDESVKQQIDLSAKIVTTIVEMSDGFTKMFLSQKKLSGDDSFFQNLARALINSKREVDFDKLDGDLLKQMIEVGGWQALGIQSDKPNQDSKHEVLSKDGADKKALVIYGADSNGAFSKDKTEINLVNSGYQVLLIDARKKAVTVQDIADAIKESGFNDLDEVYLQMHGGNARLVHDTILTLNKKGVHTVHKNVMAEDLFEVITNETGERPLKVVVSSCHSQLLTHKIADVLPKGSEVVTLSEDQIIDGEHYVYNGARHYYSANVYEGKSDVRAELAKSAYYSSSYAVPSITYGKLGECNFRTPVNINKKDIAELLSKKLVDEVVDHVVHYLDDGRESREDIAAKTTKLLKLVEGSSKENPLLEYRNNSEVNQDFTKLLGVASAIYGIYDQCGESMISDSDFKPAEDHFVAEYAMGFVMNAPAFISNSIISIAGYLLRDSNNENEL
jgi:hypothetical protein